MKIPVQPGTRGIALVIVMIAIFILSVMAAVLATSMKVETKLAQNADHDQELLWLGGCRIGALGPVRTNNHSQ